MRILLVEDDSVFAEALQQALTNQQYVVDVAGDGETGWKLAQAFAYDAVVLDLMLPHLDGIHFCQQLRIASDRPHGSLNRHTPILMITAQAASAEKVVALDSGVDDYLVKPFDFNELLARVRALLRRRDNYRSPILTWGQLQLNPGTGEVCVAGQPLHLSAKEYTLLELLMRSPNRIFSHTSLIEHLWMLEDMPTDGAVRAQIKGLRRKLKTAGATDVIETIYGLGYRLRQTEPKPIAPSLDSSPQLSLIKEPGESDTAIALTGSKQVKVNSLFEQHRQGYCNRLTVIEQAVAAFRSQALTEEVQQRARREAHTLKGSLGLFEMEEASQLSGQIEQLLQQPLQAEQVEHLEAIVTRLKQLLAPQDNTGAIDDAPDSDTAQTHTLWIVGEEKRLINSLVHAASIGLFKIEVLATLVEMNNRLTYVCPDAILVVFTKTIPNIRLELLHNLATVYPNLPVFVIAAEATGNAIEQLQQRIKVAQLGAKGFWQAPIDPTQIIDSIIQTLHSPGETTARLLVVDDDPAMLERVQDILHPWGFELTLLSDPQQFWGILERVEPDLVILDIEMPDVNGIELCQVVRNDSQWNELPILFLSAHSDDATLQKLFTVGGDDYVSKPVRAVELVARVLRRLEQAQLLQQIRKLKSS